MKHIALRMLPLLIASGIIGCGSSPTFRTQTNWTRTLSSSHAVTAKAKMKVTVTGSTVPLLGSEEVLAENIREQLSSLLRRRGFAVEQSASDYTAKLFYVTERSDKFRSPSDAAPPRMTADAVKPGTTVNAKAGLGVTVARTLNDLAARSAATGSPTNDRQTAYTHTLAIEIRNREGFIAWKGESTWDSDELDIMEKIAPAMQLLLSDLPADSLVRPAIREVKSSHTSQFYRLECAGATYACPALPNVAAFDFPKIYSNAKIDVPKSVRDPHALAAYIDLLQTAEYALPYGKEEDWIDPLKASLWKRVTLGGQYLLGKEKKPVNILIKLNVTSNGYAVEECSIATDDDYAKFNTQLSAWKRILAEYYDMF